MTDQQGYEEEQGKGGGSGFLKFCLICGCLLFLLVAGVGGYMAYQVSQLFTMDPVKVVAKVEGDILPGSKLPAGYEGTFAGKIPFTGAEFAVVVPQGMRQQSNQNNLPLMMMMITIPPGQDADQMKAQMQQALAQQGQGGSSQIQVEAQEQRTVKVRGEDIVLNESVGTGQGGVQMKQIVAMVPRGAGSSDHVLLMFMGKADVFDQAAVDAFLASIR